MPDATITSTASTFGTISGTFAADQSTVTGTVTAIIPGTLSGSVGVPGPAGVGVPAGGSAGMVLAKVDGVDYNTEWINVDPSTSWGEITGTLSDQTDLQSALNLKAPLASPALTGNPTAPTAALGDNDTSIATTAFVQQELLSGTANAKNLEVYVRNQTGSTLAAGTIVYVNGATGNRPTVTPAQANNDANSAQTMGFVKTSIANNGFGYVIVRGELENIDTSALTEGVQLYLSPTTPGAWTTTKPSAPQHMVYVGVVIRAHPTLGVILVSVMNGLELEELHNVQIVTPTNGQVLKYDAATNLWKNQTDSVGAVTSVAGRTGAVVLSNTDISGLGTMATATASDYLSKAGNLSGLANLTTARNNLGLGATNTVSFGTVNCISGANSVSFGSNTIQVAQYNEVDEYSWTDTGVLSVAEGLVISKKLGDPSGPLSVLSVTAGGITFPDATVQTTAAFNFDPTGYATESWVTSQGYLVSGDLTGYATESWVTTALGSYLTTATAASTYQTQAGMSSYLTTSAAASTYLTQSNAATTYYPLSSNPAGYLTSAPVTSVAGKTGAVTLDVADVSGAAPLASPTFTGTPSLPTGTTAVTQAAGNNTTAVATTAFVQQEVPAASTTAAGKVELATNAEVITGTSTTLALVPGHAGFLKADPRLRSLSFINGSSISGSGVATTSTPQTFSRQVYLNTLNTGRSCFIFGAIGSTNGGFGASTTKADQVDFSKKVWLSGYACMGFGGATSYLGDANTICRITLGGYSSNTTGDMTLRGIGLKKVGGVSSVVTLTVHNGTTRTDVDSTVTVPDGGGIHWVIYSDGTGNVTLYINGSQAATTTAGPTSATSSGQSSYREQVEAVATPGVRQAMNCNGGWLYIE